MFKLYADKTQAVVREKEPLTSGSVNVYPVRFGFSADWEGLERTAIFRAGAESRAVLLAEDNETVIPWEVLAKPGLLLYCGVYGTRGGHTVLPTIWADLGIIHEGATPKEIEVVPPTPELWEQELDRKGDALDYTPDGDLGLYAGDRLLSSVPVAGGGGGGTTDHRLLSHRDAEKQHPIGAVEGLQAALDTIPAPVEALTNQELEELLK